MAPRRPRDGDDPSNPSVYEGERDAEGRPHGRGRMRLDDEGVWHEGRFVRGACLLWPYSLKPVTRWLSAAA